jgi:hypothetical protein
VKETISFVGWVALEFEHQAGQKTVQSELH